MLTLVRPGLRIATRLIALVVMALVVYLLVTAAQVWLAARRNEARPTQAIVVLGAAQYNGVPSPDLSARLSHALALWQEGLAPVMVVTGGGQSGDRFTEAQASAAYLENRGIPADRIVEVGGTNTWQSLSDAASVLERRGETKVLLVSDPFHSARIGDISSAVGLTAYTSPTRTSPITGVATIPYYAKETIGVALGRIFGFGNLPGQ